MSYQGNDGKVLARTAEGGAIGAGLAVISGTLNTQAKLPTAANQMPLGFTKYAAAATGDAMDIITRGYAQAVCDGSGSAIVPGDPLTVAGVSGRLIKSTLLNGTHVCAIAQEASSAATTICTVEIVKNYLPVA